MGKINLFLITLIAPFLGLFLTLYNFQNDSKDLKIDIQQFQSKVFNIEEDMIELENHILEFSKKASNQSKNYYSQNEKITGLTKQSESSKKLSDDVYEKKILDMLGPPIGTHISNNNEIKVFKLQELGYRGYIAKVKLFNPKSLKVVLPSNSLGEKETTSSAAKRNNAIFAMNAGGFYQTKKNGKSYTQLIGNTVINSKLVEPFNGYPGDLFFVGINKKGDLIGNIPRSEYDIKKLDPLHGVSFIPILLKDGKKMSIPSKWAKSRQPRSIIGSYANDDLIFIVIDGRNSNWSKGISLERLQDKLLKLGVKNAYNLDGGGSTAMYYNGMILNKPSDGKQRPVGNNIVILP